MTGEKDLETLLASIAPVLLDGEYVFCTFPNAHYGDFADLSPIASFLEAEGLTLVVPKAKAIEQGFSYASVFKCISLSVHSSLDAVGLTAAFSQKLAEHGISANAFAGYYHDHIFVHQEHAHIAMKALNEFTR